ncbi:MAG TPA: hypothetical protein VFI19_06665 [Nocardioides sp.]|nr:hypothetical protein [Nocardioides sp.]
MPAMPATTLEGLETRRQDIAGAWWRRVFMTVLAVVIAAGLAGLLGVREATAEASENGWSLRLQYAATARAGLDVPFIVTVRHAGGLGKQVSLALTGDHLDIYETQGFHPEPSDETRDGATLYLTFDAPPDGDTLVVSYDAYIQPAAQRGRDATLGVMDAGRQVAVVDVRTRLLP